MSESNMRKLSTLKFPKIPERYELVDAEARQDIEEIKNGTISTVDTEARKDIESIKNGTISTVDTEVRDLLDDIRKGDKETIGTGTGTDKLVSDTRASAINKPLRDTRNLLNDIHEEIIYGNKNIVDGEERNPETNPQILLKKHIIHIDDNDNSAAYLPEGDPNLDRGVLENFKIPGTIYSEMLVEGHTANVEEATTQNFSNILSVVENRASGLVGTCCVGSRMYVTGDSKNPEIGVYGAPKAATYDGHLFSTVPYEHGGYAIGMELGVVDDVEDDTFIGTNYDYGSWTRRTTCLNLVGGARSQPICEGLRIMGFSNRKHAMWNAIFIGASSMKMNNNTQGELGTVGINLASWSNDKGYGDIGIKFGTANRHLYFKNNAKIGANTIRILPNNPTNQTFLRLGGGPGKSIDIVFETASGYSQESPTADPSYTTRAYIRSLEDSLYVRSKGTPIKFELTDNSKDFTVLSKSIQIGDTVLTEDQLKSLLSTLS